VNRETRGRGERLQEIQAAISTAGFEAIVLVDPTNIAYVSGFRTTPFERLLALLVPASGPLRLVVPSLERDAAHSATEGAELYVWRDEEGPSSAIRSALNGITGCVGIEKRHLTVERLELLEGLDGGHTLSGCDELLLELRIRKRPEEIEQIQRACAMVDTAIQELSAAALRAGRSEVDVASETGRIFRRLGGDPGQFHPIILTGPNSALPHGHPSSRKLSSGDLVIVDIGVASGGYYADITRTFVVAVAPDREQRRLFDVVRAAHAAGIEAARPGSVACDVDRAARRVIDDAGLGHHFVHRTGHGLGLDIHEPPYLTNTSTQTLEDGMVVTVEPGVYIEGYGGVRIEDDVLIGANGPEVLTHAPIGLDPSIGAA
jgi:Xaa-Pro aminopeptidase